MHEHITDENHKTKTLRMLLFEQSSAYGGQSLFQQFDEDVQDQVRIYLGELVNILREAHDLLNRRYGSSNGDASLNSSRSDLSVYNDTTEVSSRSGPAPENATRSTRNATRSPLLKIRWSLRDKKRTEIIVTNFADLNGRIHEHIKLLCLGSSIGVNLKHLEHLQEDANSKKLGFNVDATLRLTTDSATALPGTLELPDAWFGPLGFQPASEHFTVFNKNNQSYLVENRPYKGRWGHVDELDPVAKGRVDALAKLLQQPKEQVFRIPRCTGWKHISSQKSTAFVFENPSPQSSKLTSLKDLVASKDEKPSLGSKFQLAHGLARGIAQLHMVRWVSLENLELTLLALTYTNIRLYASSLHREPANLPQLHESFCSDNILFFPQNKPAEHQGTPVDYSQPWILGFDLSRPEGELSFGPTELYPERDVYRHPERQGQVKMQFTKLHDIYALGVVLLEIGLWAPAISLQSNRFATAKKPKVIQDQLVKQADKRLASHLGTKYRDLVLKCLTGDFGVTNDTKEDLKLQQAFRSQVVDVLKRAAENV